jgi:Retroviral aspartyl protease
VSSRFKRINTRNTLDDLKSLNQHGTVEEYWLQFEKLRSRILLEGRNFNERDFIDTFVSGLKGEIKPFVLAFKPNTVDEAWEYALYMENATENQYKKFKTVTKSIPSITAPHTKVQYPPKTTTPAITNRNTLIEQRRALGQCFKCGERYYPGHQCKTKAYVLVGQDEEESGSITREEGAQLEGIPNDQTEEAIMSMHATSDNPLANTMQFKGHIGEQPVFALIDSGSTHSFVNPSVVTQDKAQVTHSNPMIVMVANGAKMVTDSTCQNLCFKIQGNEFCHDLRLLPVQGYDIILGLDWLSTLGPMQIDWKEKWLEFQNKGKSVKLQVTTEKAVLQLCETVNLDKEIKSDSNLLVAHLWMCELNNMNPQEVPSELLPVLTQYSMVFEPKAELPPCRDIDHAIPLENHAQPVNIRPYRYSHFQRLELEKIIEELLKTKVIRPSYSPFASPALLVKKKDNTWRLCIEG